MKASSPQSENGEPRSQQSRRTGEETGFDALILKGLSGLEASIQKGDPPRDELLPTLNRSERRARTLLGPDLEEPAALEASFDTAREMRAAQEKFAARRRSAARRKEVDTATDGAETVNAESTGHFEAELAEPKSNGTGEALSNMRHEPLGLTDPAASPPAGNPMAPDEDLPAAQTRALPVIRRIEPPETRQDADPTPASSRDEEPDRTPPVARDMDETNKPIGGFRAGFPGERSPDGGRPPIPARSWPEPPGDLGAHAQAMPTVPGDSPADLRANYPEDQTSRVGLLSAVISSVLFTTLIWIGLLAGLWNTFGHKWFEGQIDRRTQPVAERAAALQSRVAAASGRIEALVGDQSILEARLSKWIRLNALQASIATSQSREEFDSILALAEAFTEPEEIAYFQSTKRRIETLYVTRITRHPGLNLKELVTEHSGRREEDLKASELTGIVLNEDVGTWDRARAAYLLRRFDGDEDVKTLLLKTVREAADIQLMFAAWDSLVHMTDYVPPEEGFDLFHLLRWWNLQAVVE